MATTGCSSDRTNRKICAQGGWRAAWERNGRAGGGHAVEFAERLSCLFFRVFSCLFQNNLAQTLCHICHLSIAERDLVPIRNVVDHGQRLTLSKHRDDLSCRIRFRARVSMCDPDLYESSSEERTREQKNKYQSVFQEPHNPSL